MPKFSQESFSKLSTCHMELQTLFYEVIRSFDCKVTEGHRNEIDQNEAFNRGVTKLKWPDGKHNKQPSMAVDVYPYPVNLSNEPKNIARFYLFAGYVLGIAERLKQEGKMTYSIRWGGDWDGDKDITDQKFNDLVHFELI
jgi:peptidoglycan L-alanyl-D-glutamate endopeptidase CwlK